MVFLQLNNIQSYHRTDNIVYVTLKKVSDKLKLNGGLCGMKNGNFYYEHIFCHFLFMSKMCEQT